MDKWLSRRSDLYPTTNNTHNKHPCPRWDLKPQSQQTSGLRQRVYWDRPTLCLTYSMKLSPSWEANRFAASQEIPHISRNPKVHYRTHKRPPPVSILGQINPVHIPTPHILEIHPNIHLCLGLPSGLSLRFPHQGPKHPLSSPIRATCPVHLILFDFITQLYV